uniref:Transmembrane protein 138 n=1 Tax=Zooxanthella nutricula TaxID=1333877 RepID=A0A7S2N3Z3_9DINO
MGIEGQDGVAPARFAWKLNAMLVLVALDCTCNGFADHLWGASYLRLNIAIFATSLALHICLLVLFFMLLGHTFLLRYGLLLEMWHEFRSVFLFSAIRFALLIGARVLRLEATLEGRPPASYWDSLPARAMYFTHNLATVAFDAWLLRKAHSLARVRFYKPALWQRHKVRARCPTSPTAGPSAVP